MLQPQTPQSAESLTGSSVRRSRRSLISAISIVFIATTYFLVQYDRLRVFANDLEYGARNLVAGRFAAPEQYRVALPLIALWLERIFHLRVNQSLPLIEALSYGGALALLYQLLWMGPSDAPQNESRNIGRIAFFMAAAQFPVLWVFPWERPETLPTALYLAAMVYIVSRASRTSWWLELLVITGLGLIQALMRADIPVVLGVALIASAWLKIHLSRPRSQMILFGTASVVAGIFVQLYLQKVAYPLSRYRPGVPKLQLFDNLNPTVSPAHVPFFFTALLPLSFSIVLLWRYRLALNGSDKLILLLCLLYLPVWICMGLLIEVRIFVPFLLLASPVVAKLWTSFLLGADEQPARF